jgi:hypothetical protein
LIFPRLKAGDYGSYDSFAAEIQLGLAADIR